jgi:hypothetical protein
MQAFFSQIKKTASLFNSLTRAYHPTQKPFLNISEKELQDGNKIRDILNTKLPRHNGRTLKGLYHAKKPKTGNRYCYSDKA